MSASLPSGDRLPDGRNEDRRDLRVGEVDGKAGPGCCFRDLEGGERRSGVDLGAKQAAGNAVHVIVGHCDEIARRDPGLLEQFRTAACSRLRPALHAPPGVSQVERSLCRQSTSLP